MATCIIGYRNVSKLLVMTVHYVGVECFAILAFLYWCFLWSHTNTCREESCEMDEAETCQQLLRQLKSVVEGLLASQLTNVWHVYGGLNRLHNVVFEIFRHGCKSFNDQIMCGFSFLQLLLRYLTLRITGSLLYSCSLFDLIYQ